MPIGSNISPATLALLDALVSGQAVRKAESIPSKKGVINVQFADPYSTPAKEGEKPSLTKSILNLLNGGREDTIERLAFETDPGQTNTYAALYKTKLRLLPDHILKRIAIQDSLVAAIVNARSAQLQAFGRPQPDRHSTGFVVEPKEGVLDRMNGQQKEDFQQRVEKAERLLTTCGHTTHLRPDDQLTFAQFLGMTSRNAVTVGRISVEVVKALDVDTGKMQFHRFRPIDAGTIFRAAPYKEQGDAVRKDALHLLEQLKNKDFKPEKYEADEYAWVQVIEGSPRQAFTADECLVHNFFPVADVELDGYPVTPIDTAIADITTHINITTHNKLYFQAGRASRGMLIIQSEDVDEHVVQRIKQQFNASINSVANAWRMPVFGIGKDDEITWQPIDSGTRDMEFQYLSDSNSRVILSAFQMSPEELPGYAHLSRGTNNQALCLNLSSQILTDRGLLTLFALLDGKCEVQIRIWTGKAWADARVFMTGQKPNVSTTLWNGSCLLTSPDHQFRAVGVQGEPAWIPQRDLKISDSVLVNKLPAPGLGEIPSYGDRLLTEDMMEVLGWMTGDGNFHIRFNKNTGNIKQGVLSWFYHHNKEREIWERHAKMLADFGLDLKHDERDVSDEEVDNLKERYGFSNIASTRLVNRLYDTDFCRWLLSLGFTSSTDGKTIPPFVASLPVGHRQAFLRGFFSADGGLTGNNIRIVICNDRLRKQTRDLLLTLGIRTQFHEGTEKQEVDGRTRRMVPGQSTLNIKDKLAFFEYVGFLQSYKQMDVQALRNGDRRWERIPAAVVSHVLATAPSMPNLSRAKKNGCSLSTLEKYCHKAGVEVPGWLYQYHCEEVVALEDLNEMVDMADVEVFDNEHAFFAEGIIVHNSESNNEYKLEAHRDVGIRPLISNFEDFINARIFPLIDEELSKVCVVRFLGLDSETPEKESIRLQQDAPLHMTFDEVLQTVEKKPVGMEIGGQLPLNPMFQQILDKYYTVGEILERFCGRQGAAQDQALSYRRDPFWFQMQQMAMQQQQLQMQQQQMAMQQQTAQAPGGAPPGEGPPPQGAEGPSPADGGSSPPEGAGQGGEDLTRSLDQVLDLLTKSEADLPPSRRRLLHQQRKLVDRAVDAFKLDMDELAKEILEVAEDFAPKPKE